MTKPTVSPEIATGSVIEGSAARKRKIEILVERLAAGLDFTHRVDHDGLHVDLSANGDDADPRLGKEFVLIGAHFDTNGGLSAGYHRVEDVLPAAPHKKHDD